ncbi:MAG: type II methionyl aminopeptidase [Candidatus Micrarchaeota archaeon]
MSEISDALEKGPPDPQENREKMIENFINAGKISQSIKKDAQHLVNPGESALDIAETIEKMIFDAKASPGFPVNISINDIGAHYTPSIEDKLLIGEKDVVKIDFGVSVEGCISDCAFTVDLSGEHGKLLEASKAALDLAVSSIKPGVGNGEIGKLVEEKVKSFGFKPIDNLTGHMLEPYNLHAGAEIPAISMDSNYKFKEGDVFAIEPFATTGKGHVVDQAQVEIYSVISEGKLRMRSSRELLLNIVKKYLTLPFAKRWLVNELKSKLVLSASLKELTNAGCIHPYPVLREAERGIISQFEHTVIIEKDSAKIIDGEISL